MQAAMQQAQAYRQANVKEYGNDLYSVEGQEGFFYGDQKLNRDQALGLIQQGYDVPLEAITSTGLGSSDNFKHSFNLAHHRSPAYQAMADNFDPNYGTKGIRNLANAVAQQIGVDPEQFDRVAGAKFADMLKSGQYGIHDQSSMNKLADVVFDEAKRITGQEIPKEVRDQAYQYTGQVRSLWDVPHEKRSGFLKQVGSGLVGGLLDAGGALLKPVGLEKYAAPIIGAGITAASGGTLGTVGAAIAGGAFAGAAPAVAAGDFGEGLRGGLKGGALAGTGAGLAQAASGAAQAATNAYGPIAGGAVRGGIVGAGQGLLSGGNVLTGLKSGLLSGGISSGVNQAFNGAPGSVGGIDDSNYDLGKSMQLQDMYYGRIPGALQKRITDGLKGFGQDVLTDRLTGLAQKALIGGGGLLAGGAIANGLLSNRQPQQPQQQQMAQQQAALPVSRFGITPQVSQYGDDFSTYGERGTGGFQFYKAPVGLLG